MHNDLGRTGAYTNETTLTSANVNSTAFGKLFTESLDGNVYAQPLYVQGLSIGGNTHNVVFVCTENNSVYAFDADSGGSSLWHVNLGTPGSSTTIGCSDLTPNIGITGTPVIDLAKNVMYLDALTVSGSTYSHKLCALSLTSGAEQFGGPKTISASLSGKTFNAMIQRQRPGLLLLNGVVYIGFGSYCDDNSYYGWLLGYNETNLTQVSSYITSPNGSQAALWMSGMAPAADSSGNIYVMTANGTFDANSGGSDYGESFLKLSSSLSVSDWFTPTDFQTLNNNDTDLGSGGPVLIGTHYVVGVGKDGNMYLCDRNSMGHYSSSGNANLQTFSATAATDTVGPSPVYWTGPSGNQYLYIWSGNADAKKFQFNGSSVNTTALGTGSVAQNDRVGGIALSANGSSNGILWGDYDGNVLYAYDAVNFPTVLWNSSQNSSRDSLGSYNKFTSPMIANGKVYMGTASSLVVYGELSGGGGGTNLFYEAESLTIAATNAPWHTSIDTNFSGSEAVFLDATATNQFMTFQVPNVQAVTYDVRLGTKTVNTRGIFQLATSSTLVGGYFNHGSPIDQYSASANYTEEDIGNVVFSTSGTKYFQFTVVGKNAASSGYTLCFDYIKMIPQ